ncbi:MAG: hypothetical protein IPG09_05095 [Ignavibacteria bacterium]|nr:hypothetical protein [Ignavibacteria bacterium]
MDITLGKSAVDKFGNYIVAGSSENSADYDYVVLKYNTSGNLLCREDITVP